MDTIEAEWEDTSTSNERKQTDELVGDCACKEEEGTRTMAMRPSRSSLSRGPQSAESRPGRLSLGAESGAGTSTGRGSGFGGGPGGEDSGCVTAADCGGARGCASGGCVCRDGFRGLACDLCDVTMMQNAESTATSPSFSDLSAIFSALDKNSDGRITHAEFITGLNRHPWIAEKLGMLVSIHQGDGTRDTFQLFFGSSKSIEFGELCHFFGFAPDHSVVVRYSEHEHDKLIADTRVIEEPAREKVGMQEGSSLNESSIYQPKSSFPVCRLRVLLALQAAPNKNRYGRTPTLRWSQMKIKS